MFILFSGFGKMALHKNNVINMIHLASTLRTFFMSLNTPSVPIYGAYISQVIRYVHCCSNYGNFLSRHGAF